MATPLSAYKWKTSAKVTRNIPRHELSLLAGCSDTSLRTIAARIEAAISVGAPAYNEGNHEGCYRAYAAAAVAIDHELKDCAQPRDALLAGVRKADKLVSFDDKAWAMRDAFDGVLDVIARRDAPRRRLSRRARAPRAVASAAAARRLQPRPTDGRSRAPSRAPSASVHRSTTRETSRPVSASTKARPSTCSARSTVAPAPRRRCMAGVSEASRRPGFDDKAWAMRDAFDGLIDLLQRKWGTAA